MQLVTGCKMLLSFQFYAVLLWLLGVPAYSNPVEQLFSIAGKLFKPDHCRLADNTVKTLMFIHCNSKFLRINQLCSFSPNQYAYNYLPLLFLLIV